MSKECKHLGTHLQYVGWAYVLIERLLAWAGNIDFIVTRVRDPDWVGEAIRWLLDPPAGVLLAVFVVSAFLITWDLKWRKPKQTTVAAPSLKDAQTLFCSTANPARNSQGGIINSMVRGIANHPNPSVKASIQLFQSKAPATPAFGKLSNAIREIDFVAEEELKNRVQWFWNEYREKRCLILAYVPVVQESDIDVPAMPQYRHWLEADRRLRDELRRFCANPGREIARKAIENHGWDENVTDALWALLPQDRRNGKGRKTRGKAKGR
jgi:hypothetical protein